ncbi:MAG TPA: DinB family protein [Pyrinomonadaceae bacterium]|jgi:uncharacterized damage-inducible protein DinB|nr:DinB family protein [Pyrinomonadaceae bacterium]
MQTLELIRRMMTYNRWADRLTIDALKSRPAPDSRALRAFVHLLIAEREWLVRLSQNKDSTGYDFWPEMSLAAGEELMAKVHRAYDELLAGLTEEDLAKAAVYRNSKGIVYRTTYRDILCHVMFHSAYHRGQVAMAERSAGDVPAYTDFIAFVRERDTA